MPPTTDPSVWVVGLILGSILGTFVLSLAIRWAYVGIASAFYLARRRRVLAARVQAVRGHA